MWTIWWYTTSESSYIEQRDIKPQSPEQHGQVFFRNVRGSVSKFFINANKHVRGPSIYTY